MMIISVDSLPVKYRGFAIQEVVLRDGRRMSELDAAIEEAKEAAEIAGTKVTKQVVLAILDKNMEAEAEG